MAFHITHQPFGSYTELFVVNITTGDYFSVIPAHGAMVRQLVLNSKSGAISLLHTPATPEALIADETYASALLFPFPSRIPFGRYEFEGKMFKLPENEAKQQMAIHGFVARQPFEVVGQQVGEDKAALTFRYPYDGSYPGYPFPFDLRVTYSLAADGVFSVQYEAQNTGDTSCPVAFGWHPYFTFGEAPVDSLTIELPVTKQVRLAEDLIPMGEDTITLNGPVLLNNREFDAAFVVEESIDGGVTTVLRSPEQQLSLCIWQETGPKKFPYLVVFTHPARDRIAIEPLTSNVNSFNNGQRLITLQPNSTVEGEIRVWIAEL